MLPMYLITGMDILSKVNEIIWNFMYFVFFIKIYKEELYTVRSRYLDFGYLESPLISKRKFGPCFNSEI